MPAETRALGLRALRREGVKGGKLGHTKQTRFQHQLGEQRKHRRQARDQGDDGSASPLQLPWSWQG